MLKPWQICALIVLLFLILLFAAFAVYSSEHESVNCTKQYAGQTERTHECEKDITEENIALGTIITAIATLLLAIGAAVQAAITLRADGTTRIIAQAALDANRPWLNFSVAITGSLREEGAIARAPCTITITNVGKSPAAWTEIIATFEHINTQKRNDIFPLRSAAVFPDIPLSIETNAFLYHLKTADVQGWSHLKLVIKVTYGFTGDEGCTSKTWEYSRCFYRWR